MTKPIITAILGLGLAAIGAWLHVKGKNGRGWGFVALILIITSCSTAE